MDRTLGDRDNRAIGRETLADQDNQGIDQETSADPDNRAIGRGTLADRVDLETAPETSAGRDDREIGLATLADRVNQGATLFRTFPVASPMAIDGRIGATSIATTFGTGGKITEAISTIGSTTIGGSTTTLTFRTIQDLATGARPLGPD
jgi:hypothetical protein